MGFVLVQYLDPKQASLLPELLGRTTYCKHATIRRRINRCRVLNQVAK
jgi:hypothetical protein